MIEDVTDSSTGFETGEPGRPVLLQVVPALDLGGVERATIDVAKAAREVGFVSLVASSGGRLVHGLKRARIDHIELPLGSKSPATIYRNIARLSDVIRRCRVDIVHARSRAPAWSARFAAARAGAHFMTTFHSPYGGAGNPAKRLYNSVMARGERVIAISEFVAELVRGTYGVADDRLVVVPRGIDMKRFDPASVSAERIIKLAGEWRLPDGAPVILLPARLSRWKGHTFLIDAVTRLGRQDVIAVLAGDGADRYRRELAALVAARGLNRVVRFVGTCDDMAAAYMLADVVVSASLEPEGFGRVAVEAQAMGRPVIATDHGGARETVAPGETARLVQPGDVAGLADALIQALALDRARREALAAKARHHVVEAYSVERMCHDTLKVYADLIGLT